MDNIEEVRRKVIIKLGISGKQWDWLYSEICQLFEPLDDKDLREQIADKIGNNAIYHKDKPFLHQADEILALLPDIEEAIKKEREKIITELWAIHAHPSNILHRSLREFIQALKGE